MYHTIQCCARVDMICIAAHRQRRAGSSWLLSTLCPFVALHDEMALMLENCAHVCCRCCCGGRPTRRPRRRFHHTQHDIRPSVLVPVIRTTVDASPVFHLSVCKRVFRCSALMLLAHVRKNSSLVCVCVCDWHVVQWQEATAVSTQ